eukprot:CAMPEP_0195262824 /NCGR_PEP_ID=MMETSP0706-20130129/9969_1 /TAXON_ID=33640 /ORGANISM="Asterionellopsis glacialis, Strain CCMP134" /LENGTH=63 /DNA_ID=CAMNT_0040316947 /DNA_START=90 /DNA_END=281 /DNA_ORIENTATION=-
MPYETYQTVAAYVKILADALLSEQMKLSLLELDESSLPSSSSSYITDAGSDICCNSFISSPLK